MASEYSVSFYSLDNLGQLLVQLEKHCVALELLTREVIEPDGKDILCAVYDLLFDRISYLEQTVSECQNFLCAVLQREHFGPQEFG